AIGVEQRADVRAHLEHDLVDVVGGVDLVGDGLELLLERQASTDIRVRRSLMAEDCAHRIPPCCWTLHPSHKSTDLQRHLTAHDDRQADFCAPLRPPSSSETLKPR